MGRLIYQPKGKAREYSPWACNLYNGCTNRCEYCYNRKGVACKLLGKDDVTLKSGLTIPSACELFAKEIKKYREQIIADGKGLFFNFVSDPFLDETWQLNMICSMMAVTLGVNVVFLSKKVPPKEMFDKFIKHKDMVKVGFTLTGIDEIESGADSNEKRIDAIYRLSSNGISTWASIEPIISISSSKSMIEQAYNVGCREFKIGLLSGKKDYSPQDVRTFYNHVNNMYEDCKIQWKDSVLDYLDKVSDNQLSLFHP